MKRILFFEELTFWRRSLISCRPSAIDAPPRASLSWPLPPYPWCGAPHSSSSHQGELLFPTIAAHPDASCYVGKFGATFSDLSLCSPCCGQQNAARPQWSWMTVPSLKFLRPGRKWSLRALASDAATQGPTVRKEMWRYIPEQNVLNIVTTFHLPFYVPRDDISTLENVPHL
jgi:hypothetical protein